MMVKIMINKTNQTIKSNQRREIEVIGSQMGLKFNRKYLLIISGNKKLFKLILLFKEYFYINLEWNYPVFSIMRIKQYCYLYYFQIKVIIAAEYVKKTNPEVLKRNIYGSETYTSNSDCVCIAIHSGLVNFNNFITKKY